MEAARLSADSLEWMAVELNFGSFEYAEARLLELVIWAMGMRLNWNNFEWASARLGSGSLEQIVMLAIIKQPAAVVRLGKPVVVMRLESEGLEQMVKLTAGASFCKVAMVVILNLGSLGQGMARHRSDNFGWVVARLCGFCELAVEQNLDDLEQAAAGLCKLRTQVAARLSMGGVMQTRSVLGAGVTIRVAHCHQKMTHQCLSCMYVAGGSSRCWCYVGLDVCGMSIAAVCLVCA